MNLLLETTVHARNNPIKPLGHNSISRFAALLTDGKRQVVGFNSYKTHPLQAKFGTNEKCLCLHAEVASILLMIRLRSRFLGSRYSDVTDLSDCKMYVARVLKDGTAAFARPCSGCQRALVHFNINQVCWTE